MTTATADILDAASLRALLGPQLTAEQASLIFQQGQEAVVFALLSLAKQLAEKLPAATTPDPSTPSGQTPPYSKPAAKGPAEPRGARSGHPGTHRPTPPRIDARQDHALDACPNCHGPVKRSRASRTRIIEDIPADITPVVTEHTIPRYWCPGCRTTVEPVVPDALPGSTIGPAGRRALGLASLLARHHPGPDHRRLQLPPPVQAVRQAAWSRCGTGCEKSSWPGIWRSRRRPWTVPCFDADETGWRVNGTTHLLWCFTTTDLTYYMIDRSRGSPALKRFFKKEFAGVLVTDFWAAYNAVVSAKKQKCLPHLLRDHQADRALPSSWR